MIRVGAENPAFKFRLNLGFPFFPLLVVTKITPLAAREPYTAAEASFKIEIFSISLGSM